MAIPGLKDFTRLVGAARSEFEAWSITSAAAGIPPARFSYIRDVLEVIERSGDIRSLAAGFGNVFAIVESFGRPVAEISPSLLKLSALLAEREKKQPFQE